MLTINRKLYVHLQGKFGWEGGGSFTYRGRMYSKHRGTDSYDEKTDTFLINDNRYDTESGLRIVSPGPFIPYTRVKVRDFLTEKTGTLAISDGVRGTLDLHSATFTVDNNGKQCLLFLYYRRGKMDKPEYYGMLDWDKERVSYLKHPRRFESENIGSAVRVFCVVPAEDVEFQHHKKF